MSYPQELQYIQQLEDKIVRLEEHRNQLIDALKQIVEINYCKCGNCIYCIAESIIEDLK